MKLTMGFIGLGNMGSLLLNQMKLLNNKLIEFCIYDRNEHKIQANQIGYNMNACSDESDLISKSNIIFLSVKPAEYDNLLEKVKQFNPNAIVVNITIGYSLQRMVDALGNVDSKVVRIMPSTTISTKNAILG